jgi:L-threonylcarbamoyladenylate synthase
MAAGLIRRGWIVAFPTETVYGLGDDVFDESAIARIFKAKRRPPDNPLIAHIGSIEQVGSLAAEVKPFAQELMDRFFPGPLTLVLRKTDRVPLIATAGLDTIGVRMPRHPLAHRFLKACETPIVAPSANLSGRPSPTTWRAVFEDLNGRIDCILQGEATEIGLESTVVDCTGDRPVILRLGSVGLSDIRSVVPDAVLTDDQAHAAPKSPGLKHKHYSPAAAVRIVSDVSEVKDGKGAAFIGLSRNGSEFDKHFIARDAAAYAHHLFEFFRECDREGIRTIYCEAVQEDGIGAALMDRIRRAAQG